MKTSASKMIIVAALLALALFFSGCLGGNKGTVVKGLVISDFRSEYSEINAGETSMVALGFENQGDFDAENVQASLVRKGAFSTPVEKVDFAVLIEKPLEGVFSGDEFYWDLKAPNVLQDRTEEVQARISYDYQTKAFATINFIPQDIARTKGTELFTLNPSSSNSPVGISVQVNQPIIILPGEETKKVTFDVVLTNVGGGRVNAEKIPAEEINEQCSQAEGCIDELQISTTGTSCEVFSGESKEFYCCRKAKRVGTGADYYWLEGECPSASGYTQSASSQCFQFGNTKSCAEVCSYKLPGVSHEPAPVYDKWDSEIRCSCNILEEYQELINGIKLLHGTEGRYTITEDFKISEKDAATSCQLAIEANYRYELDSPVLPVTIKAPKD